MAERISASKQEQIINLYLDGMKIRAIAEAVGVGSASVFNVLDKRGIKPNRQPRADSVEYVRVDQVIERMVAAERERVRVEAENRRLRAEVTRLKNADRHRRANDGGQG